MGGVVFFRLSYFDYSDLQLFAIFRFEVDFSETYLMTSAKNSVLERPNLKIFWGRTPRDPPYKACAFSTRDNAPRYKKSSFGPVYASAETHLIEVCLVTLTVRSVCERGKKKRTCYSSLPIKTGEWYLQRRSHSSGRIFHRLKNLTGHFVHTGLWTARRLISLYGSGSSVWTENLNA